MQSEMGSGKTLAYLLPVVHCLASSTDDGQRPSSGGGSGAAGADRKSGGTWCVLLCPTRKPATQTHSFADQLCRSSFPRIVPGCLSGWEKCKSEKARLRRGMTLLVATPGRLLNHLKKTESLPLSLRQTAALSGLSLTSGRSPPGRGRLGGAGGADFPAASRMVPRPGGDGSGPPGHSRACWCRRR